MKKRCILLYHFYHPDDVISAQLFTELAEFFAANGLEPEVWTSNRYCHEALNVKKIQPPVEVLNGVKIRRFSRPDFPQHSNTGRLLNSFWISQKWLWRLWLQRYSDTVIIGTDPQFGFYIIPLVKLFRPKIKFILWDFDLYPDAVYASGKKFPGFIKRMINFYTALCYKKAALIADLGECMKKRIADYTDKVQMTTLVPWALKESYIVAPPDPEVRKKLFGETKLTLLYSGTLGQAHCFDEFVALARECRRRNASISFCFAGRGKFYDILKTKITPEDTNIHFAGFASEDELKKRLEAADITMISLRPDWDGVVLPSKYFGSLAVGRPVLYCGSENSDIKKWIEQSGAGLFMKNGDIGDCAGRLQRIAENRLLLADMQQKALDFYRQNFSKEIVCNKFMDELSKL